MLDKGTLVIYGGEGVCRIDDIICQSFGIQKEQKEYYVLVPIRNSLSKFYVPLDNEKLTSRLLNLLKYDEIVDLINDTEALDWIDDNKQRGKLYKEIFSSYDRKTVFSLAKLLYKAKNGEIPNVKKLYVLDEDAIRKVTQILYAELSYSLDVSSEDVLAVASGKIQLKRKN